MVWETTLEVARVRFRVNLLGAVAFAAYAALTLLSFVQAPALWSRHPGAPQAMAFFESLAERFPPLSLMRLLSTNTAVIVSYFVPLSLATLATLALVLMLARRRGALDATVAALLLRWSYAFAAVSLFAFPIFTQDFWLSAVWGRMVAQGLNPYHQLFTPELIAGLPLDHFPMLMSYGPAWALLSGAVMLIAGRDLLIIAILFKAILGAAWIAALILVDKIMVARPPVERCIAIVLIGWLPIGVLQTVAEGHNDIIMAVGALLWMHLLLRGRATAPVALILSALAKYVTAPLLALDAIWAWRVQRLSWRAFVLRYVAPGLVGLAVLAVFYRSPQFFEGTRVISEWHFLQPRHALYAFDNWIPAALLYPLELVITAAFALMTAYYLVAFWRQADADHLAKAALAIMTTISFAGVAHLWPWYMVWTLGFAALVPSWWLSRYVIGVAILVPFTFAFWWIDSLFDGREWGALALYAGAALWVLVTRPATATTASDAQNRDSAAQAIEAR